MDMTRVTRTLIVSALCMILGCSTVPRKYLREAVPDLTFATLAASPQSYQGRLVVLGAVIMKEEMQDRDLWLSVKNRPLDEDYRPQLPPGPSDQEAGRYWIVVKNHHTLPGSYRHWADMTVVGRVVGSGPDGQPILQLVYARGWGLTPEHHGVWEHTVDENYMLKTPPELILESTQ